MGKYNHFKPKNIVNCNSVTVELPIISEDISHTFSFTISVKVSHKIIIVFYIALIPARRIDALHKRYTKCILINSNINYIN